MIIATLKKNGTPCLLKQAIKGNKLNEKQVLKMAEKIPEAYYVIGELIERGSLSPESIMKAVFMFYSEYSVITATIKCRKLSPEQMLEVLKISNNNQYFGDAIKKVYNLS